MTLEESIVEVPQSEQLNESIEIYKIVMLSADWELHFILF